jgi:aspartokinase/homoserine dehydrogenase 1
MQVLKFGGSSVGSPDTIKQVKAIIQEAVQRDRTIVVFSAFGGVTDKLLHCGTLAAGGHEEYKDTIAQLTQRHIDAVKGLLPLTAQSPVLSMVVQQCNEIEAICNGIFLLREFSDKTRDRILSYGELIASRIIAAYLTSEGLPNCWIDARSLISTDSHFTKATVDLEKTAQQVKNNLTTDDAPLYIVPGFIASDKEGATTTLGRGGSDYTASIVGAAADASVVEIWTDVSGMMTADPRLVSNAKAIERISYHEAMELSHFGAKVIYPPTIQPVMKRGIPVLIKNTFEPGHAGTRIEAASEQANGNIRGISSIGKIALLSLEGSGMVGIPGFSKRLFETLAHHAINVILITQSSSEHSICVGVDEGAAQKAKDVIDDAFSIEIEKGMVNPLLVERGLAIVALVGDSMKSHPGTSGKMFGVIGRNGVNIRAIAQGSSERNISAVIAAEDVKKSLNVLHEEFFEPSYKQLNLFIAGAGNVGSKLLAQIRRQQEYLLHALRLQIRVVGLANSRRMLFSNDGIDLRHWKEALETGDPMHLPDFIKRMQKKNLRNSVFVDVTANDKVAMVYDDVFQKSISVVACNKIACSSPYGYYKKLKDLARDHNASFLFETNVGASLPIIGTLNDLLRSGDRIRKIEAVLSGTLNFVFNNYNGEQSFAQVVHQAQTEGYTEPDPRLDLSGTDVMRKIMILARETGEKLEMDEITNHSFMPPSCMEGNLEAFYREMENQEAHFNGLYQAAANEGKKLKFVAKYEDGKASVGLQHIEPQHDFYHLYGKDNIVLFYTDRYPEQPMVVKGAGAGAEVTASGVFADIIRAVRS